MQLELDHVTPDCFKDQKKLERYRKWCQISNFGVTPFGAFPELINFDRLMIDTLHLRLNVVQAMVRYVSGYAKKLDVTRNVRGVRSRGFGPNGSSIYEGFLSICREKLKVGEKAIRAMKKNKAKHFTGELCIRFLEAFSPRVTVIRDGEGMKYEKSHTQMDLCLREYFDLHTNER